MFGRVVTAFRGLCKKVYLGYNNMSLKGIVL